MTLLKIQNLNKEYRKNQRVVKVLDHINCEFEKNKIHVIQGPSGCGKTTLLNIIAGLIKPTNGRVLFEDKTITAPNSKIGIVFQDLRLFPWLKVKDNIAFGLKIRKSKDIELKVNKYLKLVGLSEYKEYYPIELSGGMKQRLAIARSLILKPQLLLMDEPFGDLDLKTRKQMQKLVLRIQKSFKTTIIFITHDLDEAIYLGDRIYVLSGIPGKIKNIYDNKTFKELNLANKQPNIR
jgi:NitT/TauT family transport system ATP-binding protein